MFWPLEHTFYTHHYFGENPRHTRKPQRREKYPRHTVVIIVYSASMVEAILNLKIFQRIKRLRNGLLQHAFFTCARGRWEPAADVCKIVNERMHCELFEGEAVGDTAPTAQTARFNVVEMFLHRRTAVGKVALK
jgi:hypothetical protein